MEVLINKISEHRYKIHLIKPRNLGDVVTYEIFKEYITRFNTMYELINDVWRYYATLTRGLFMHCLPPSLSVQVWDIPYYNHAKRTMLTFEMFKLLN